MRIHKGKALVLGISVVLMTTVLASVSHAAPTCFGKRATIVGTSAKETLKGTPKADVIVGMGGNDKIEGLAGNDRLCGGKGAEKISGGGGHDKIEGLGGFRDTLKGGGGNDVLLGGEKDDELHGGPGDDMMDGGAGTSSSVDWLSYEFSATGVNANLATGVATGEGNDTLRNFEIMVGSTHDDVLVGNPSGASTWFYPLAGDDDVTGGDGWDTIAFFYSDSPVVVDLASGKASGEGKDTLRAIESVIGTDFADTLLGDDETNELDGWGGNDSLDGRGGGDFLDGNAGADSCVSDELDTVVNCE